MHKAHKQFVWSELRKMIPEGSFASYIVESLAVELRSTLETIEEGQPDAYWEVSPAEGLFTLLDDGWSLEVEWFQWTDGIFRDDDEEEIPPAVNRHLSASEQMAVYGLSVLSDGLDDIPDISEKLIEEKKVSKEELSEWSTEALLEAYQALVFAQKLDQSYSPETGKQSRAKLVDFSALGAAGAKKRHAPQAELKKWAIEKYRAKKWQSANEAAHALTTEVVAYSVSIGAFLKPSNAQRTIYSWFLKSA
ncbi:MAG: hypothetical protein ACM3X0_05790 [Bacteroidota bacterium]